MMFFLGICGATTVSVKAVLSGCEESCWNDGMKPLKYVLAVVFELFGKSGLVS